MFTLSFKLPKLNSIILICDNAILVCPRLTQMTFHSLSHPYHLLSPQLPCSPVISNLPSPPLFSCIILPLQLSSLNSPAPPAHYSHLTHLSFSLFFRPLISSTAGGKRQSSLPVTFDKQMILWCQQDINHVPVQPMLQCHLCAL